MTVLGLREECSTLDILVYMCRSSDVIDGLVKAGNENFSCCKVMLGEDAMDYADNVEHTSNPRCINSVRIK